MSAFNPTDLTSAAATPLTTAPRKGFAVTPTAAATAAASLALLLPASLAGADVGPRIATMAEREALLERVERILPGGDRAAFRAGLSGIKNPLSPRDDDGDDDTTTLPPPPPPPPPAELTPQEVLAAAAMQVGRPSILISPQRRVIVLAGGTRVAEGETFEWVDASGETRVIGLAKVERKALILTFAGERLTVSLKRAPAAGAGVIPDGD